jgi:hypothetical protein
MFQIGSIQINETFEEKTMKLHPFEAETRLSNI